jgi:hypothetical protein
MLRGQIGRVESHRFAQEHLAKKAQKGHRLPSRARLLRRSQPVEVKHRTLEDLLSAGPICMVWTATAYRCSQAMTGCAAAARQPGSAAARHHGNPGLGTGGRRWRARPPTGAFRDAGGDREGQAVGDGGRRGVQLGPFWRHRLLHLDGGEGGSDRHGVRQRLQHPGSADLWQGRQSSEPTPGGAAGHNAAPAMLEHGTRVACQPATRAAAAYPPCGRSTAKKPKFRVRIVTSIGGFSHFDGTERWASFWFCFGARRSRYAFFGMLPCSARLVPC